MMFLYTSSVNNKSIAAADRFDELSYSPLAFQVGSTEGEEQLPQPQAHPAKVWRPFEGWYKE